MSKMDNDQIVNVSVVSEEMLTLISGDDEIEIRKELAKYPADMLADMVKYLKNDEAYRKQYGTMYRVYGNKTWSEYMSLVRMVYEYTSGQFNNPGQYIVSLGNSLPYVFTSTDADLFMSCLEMDDIDYPDDLWSSYAALLYVPIDRYVNDNYFNFRPTMRGIVSNLMCDICEDDEFPVGSLGHFLSTTKDLIATGLNNFENNYIFYTIYVRALNQLGINIDRKKRVLLELFSTNEPTSKYSSKVIDIGRVMEGIEIVKSRLNVDIEVEAIDLIIESMCWNNKTTECFGPKPPLILNKKYSKCSFKIKRVVDAMCIRQNYIVSSETLNVELMNVKIKYIDHLIIDQYVAETFPTNC